MVVQVSGCNPHCLKQLLDEQLNEVEQRAVAEHLEECGKCRSALETLAADGRWWDEASRLLGEEADDSWNASNGTNGSVSDPDRDELSVSPLSTVDSFIGTVPLDFLEPSDSPAMLGRLGDYDIIEPIGCGGMGIVLKGYDSKLNRFVAVKVLAPHYATSIAAKKRFAREAQAAAAVVHPHVLAIHSVDATGRLPFLVMPFIDGESLQERVRRNGQLATREVLRIGIQAARGLQAAHDQGLVHRDIKPGNILLERDVDRAMLTDFGLARAIDDASMTRSGVIAGTPQFMSPEQALGEAVDHRSDLFSLGSVLYTMCAGRPPFRAETTMGLLRRIVDTDARPLQQINTDIPVWLSAIIGKLHAKQPDDRFSSAGELADLLEGCLAHVQQPSVTPLPDSLPRYDGTSTRFRPPTIIAGGLLAMTATVAVCVLASFPGWFTDLLEDATAPAAPTTSSVVPERPPQEPVFNVRAGKEPVARSPQTIDTAWESDLDRQMDSISRQLDVLERQLTVNSATAAMGNCETASDQDGSSLTDSVKE